MATTTSSRRGSRARRAPAAQISTYSQAVRCLYDRVNYERMRVIRLDAGSFKLDRMQTLLEVLGNPHEHVRMVHVAGTVGKGSTVAMIASMLEGCGYAVGQFTSPHLIDVRERITINNQPISRGDFTDLMQRIASAAAGAAIEPTFFEVLTAMAFKHFAEQAVDIAVIEAGLGGRLDSTNVIRPEVSVITQIDYDHTHLLGHGLDDIAREKAGIFKRGVPALTHQQPPAVAEVLKQCASEVDAPLRVISEDIEYSHRFGSTAALGPHSRVCVATETSEFMHLAVPLPGEHQAINCALALAVIDALQHCGLGFPEVALHEGLARTSLPGRMELVWDRPRILVDGAHNPAAVGALMRSVGAHVPYDSMVCVFGCCEDKDIPTMLEKISLGGDKMIFTRAKTNPRAADPYELQRQFAEQSGKMHQVAPTLPEALDLASRAVGRDDLICVTGSFYLVGETKKYLADLDRRRRAR